MDIKDRDLYIRLRNCVNFMLSSRDKLDKIIGKMEVVRENFKSSYARWATPNKPMSEVTDEDLIRLNRLLDFHAAQMEPLATKFEAQRLHFDNKVSNTNHILALILMRAKVAVPMDADIHTQLKLRFEAYEAL